MNVQVTVKCITLQKQRATARADQRPKTLDSNKCNQLRKPNRTEVLSLKTSFLLMRGASCECQVT